MLSLIVKFMCPVILQVGKPTDDWKNDPEGIPEGAVSKAVRGATKLATQVHNFFSVLWSLDHNNYIIILHLTMCVYPTTW